MEDGEQSVVTVTWQLRIVIIPCWMMSISEFVRTLLFCVVCLYMKYIYIYMQA